MPPLRLPPYEARPGEDLLEKCRRIKREIQAAARGHLARKKYAKMREDHWAPGGRGMLNAMRRATRAGMGR